RSCHLTNVLQPRRNELTAPVSVTPLRLGAEASGAIAAACERNAYIFTLTLSLHDALPILTNAGNLTWTLAGPAGTAVSDRAFNASNSDTMLDLVAGDYTLTTDGTVDATGAYSFLLSDLESAAPISPGTMVSGALDPASETD